MVPIADSESAAAFCRRLAAERFVCVDTEFMRERTYYPRLCLVQLAGEREAAAIDALAPGIDLGPVLDLMADPGVLKVFHACRQDIEIFHNLAGRVPAPVFDTQVGAMVCGYGDAVSYDKLVRRLTGARIDKTSRFTDWARRPLSEEQIGYALSDVTHLREVYERLSERLRATGRESWLEEEARAVTDPAAFAFDPGEAWRRLKVKNGKPRFLAIARELAAWREAEARRRDIPRGWLLRDDVLLDVAARAPRTPKDLAKVRNITEKFASGRTGEALLAAVGRARDLPEDALPRPEKDPRAGEPAPAIVELLRVLLKLKSEKHDVARKLIASAEDLDAIARDDDADTPALRGWRRGIFGDDALALKRGELALSARDGEVELVRL